MRYAAVVAKSLAVIAIAVSFAVYDLALNVSNIAMVSGLVAFVLFAALGGARLQRVNEVVGRIPPTVFVPIAAVLTVAICSAIALEPFGGIPRAQDEVNYFFQAKLFASGQLSVDSHPLADFFQYRFFVNDGSMYSLFQPGWPLLLVVGHWISAPWLIPPIMAGVSVAFFYGIVHRISGKSEAFWGTLLLIGCATFLFQSASMMAHGPAAALGLGAFYACLRGTETGQTRWFLLAGGFAGLLFTVRIATGFALAIPVAVCGVALVIRGNISWKNAGLLVVGTLPGVAMQLAHNLLMSGSIMEFAQARYFELTEPIANCHRLGIGDGIGCPYEHGPDLGKNGFTWGRAFEVTQQRLKTYRFDFFGVGFGAFLMLLPWLAKTRPKVSYLLLAMPISLGTVYFFYYYHGSLYGCRYYFEAIPYAFVLIILGVSSILTDLSERSEWVSRLGSAIVLSMCVFLVAQSGVSGKQKWEQYSKWWVAMKMFEQTVDDADLLDAVVLVPKGDRLYWNGFWRNAPNLDGRVVVVRDLGPKTNRQLKDYFPERTFYRFYASKNGGGLRKIDLAPTGGLIAVEAESKFPVAERKNGYALSQSMRPWKVPASQGRQLFFDAKKVGAEMTLPQYFFEGGSYEVTGAFGGGPDYGQIEVEVSGTRLSPKVDGFSPKVRISSWAATERVRIEAGAQRVTIRVVGKNAQSRGFVAGVDKLQFRRVD